MAAWPWDTLAALQLHRPPATTAGLLLGETDNGARSACQAAVSTALPHKNALICRCWPATDCHLIAPCQPSMQWGCGLLYGVVHLSNSLDRHFNVR